MKKNAPSAVLLLDRAIVATLTPSIQTGKDMPTDSSGSSACSSWSATNCCD